jgi:nitrate reductase gamma subunit
MHDPLLFAWLPYLAVALLLFIPPWRCLALLDRARAPRPARGDAAGGRAAGPAGEASRVETYAADAASAIRSSWRGGKAWRIGLVVLAGGHLLAIALPAQVVLWDRVTARLLLLEAAGLTGGLLALAGLAGLLRGRLRPAAEGEAAPPAGGFGRSLADTLLLTLLALVMVSGVAVALIYRWGSSWSAVALTPYLRSLVELRPDLSALAGLPSLVRLHVLAGIASLAVVPFTDLAYLGLKPLAAFFGMLAAARRRGALALRRSTAT